MDFTLRNLDVVAVKMTPPKIYQAMSRGTIDGAVFPYMSAVSYGMERLLKQGTEGQNFGTVALTYSIGETKWKSLSPADRDVLMQVGESISSNACVQFNDTERRSQAKFESDGMRVITFAPADEVAFQQAFDKVASEWAHNVDGHGKPGTLALQNVRQAIETAH